MGSNCPIKAIHKQPKTSAETDFYFQLLLKTVSEPRHLIEGGASRYTALAVPAPLEGGDFPSTAWSHLSSGNSLHRNKTDIGGQGACGPCGQPRNFCLERRRLRIRTRFQDLPYQEPCSYVV